MALKKLIEDQHLTSYQLSKLTLIPCKTINEWVNGTTDPLQMPLRAARQISKLLGMTLDEFYRALKLT